MLKMHHAWKVAAGHSLRSVRDLARRVQYARRYFGDARSCPVCERSCARFMPFGREKREDAWCPYCGSLERHRLVWTFLKKRTDLFDGRPKRVLHIGPETCLSQRLRTMLGNQYVTADLHRRDVDVRLDITNITYPDESWDVLYCSHVLEHVPDDRLAMRELLRILRRTGWAVLLVPMRRTLAVTDEDASVTDSLERLRRFGNEDHVRQYGADYPDRLRECGWQVAATDISDIARPDEAARFGLTRSGTIYQCRRQN